MVIKLNQRGVTVWLTGLSGAGKTTISLVLEQELRMQGCKVEVLDGDVVRQNLSKGLGFSKEDRDENIRRIGFVAHLLTRNDVIVIVCAISPYYVILPCTHKWSLSEFPSEKDRLKLPQTMNQRGHSGGTLGRITRPSPQSSNQPSCPG